MISVLLPTVRPHLVRRSFDSIEAAAGNVPYEVIVVADFLNFTSSVLAPHCKWITRSRAGVVDALNAAFAHSQGEHIFSFNDEAVLEPRSLEWLWHEATRYPGHLLAPRHAPEYSFVYYKKPFAPFPFAARSLFDSLGGIADSRFHCFYHDPDLSLRAHAKGVPVRTIDQAVIWHHNGEDEISHENTKRYRSNDQAVFRERWDHLGEFKDA